MNVLSRDEMLRDVVLGLAKDMHVGGTRSAGPSGVLSPSSHALLEGRHAFQDDNPRTVEGRLKARGTPSATGAQTRDPSVPSPSRAPRSSATPRRRA